MTTQETIYKNFERFIRRAQEQLRKLIQPENLTTTEGIDLVRKYLYWMNTDLDMFRFDIHLEINDLPEEHICNDCREAQEQQEQQEQN